MISRGVKSGPVDNTDTVIPRSSPLRPGVAVCVGTMSVSYVVLPGAVVNVAVVVIVTTVTDSLVMLPATYSQKPTIFPMKQILRGRDVYGDENGNRIGIPISTKVGK